MADRVRLANAISSFVTTTGPLGSSAAVVSDAIRSGYTMDVLDLIKPVLKKERPPQQLRAVQLLDGLLQSPVGPQLALQLATDAWMDRFLRVAKESPSVDVKIAVEQSVARWSGLYNYPSLLRAAEKLRHKAYSSHASGRPMPTTPPISPIPVPTDVVSNNSLTGASALTRGRSFVASGGGTVGSSSSSASAARGASFSNNNSFSDTASTRRPGGEGPTTPPRHRSHARQTHVFEQTLSPMDILMVNIQADLASVELGLQRPEMMRPETVADVINNRAHLTMILQEASNLSDNVRMNLMILQSSIDEVLSLYNALYDPDAAATSTGSLGLPPPHPTQGSAGVVEAEVDPAVLTELEAEKAKLEEKLSSARAKNKKAQAYIEKLTSEVAQKRAATASSPNVVVSHYTPSGELRASVTKVLRAIRAARSHLKSMGQAMDVAQHVTKSCHEIRQAANGLPLAVDTDKKQDAQTMVQLQELYTSEMKLRKQYYNTIQELKGNIRVYCRVRPMSESEKAKGGMVTSFPNDGEVVLRDEEKNKSRQFEFDAVFRPDTRQEKVFADTRPLIDSVVDGYNVCIFAYGQTGSGKTFTMSGPDHDIGINRRALCRLFEIVEERRETETCTVEVAVLEIYNEEIRDLARKKTEVGSLTFDVKTGGETGHYVTNLSFSTVTSASEIENLMSRASQNRSEGRTNMNLHSSRSHMILYVVVRTVNLQTGLRTYGKLSLVDLAGSERLDKSGATGDTLVETVHINKSLSALGDVICNLSSGAAHVPFRNSKLTFLLQDSMTGQAKVLMFVCVSPAAYNMAESLSSLSFATRARGVSLGQAKRNVS